LDGSGAEVTAAGGDGVFAGDSRKNSKFQRKI
jgi:hypothetical protein